MTIVLDNAERAGYIGRVDEEEQMGAMTLEQIKAADRVANPRKLFPSTIAFLKELREEVNKGKERRGEEIVPWTAWDEQRYN